MCCFDHFSLAADSSRDNLIMNFNADLMAQCEALEKEVMNLRLEAQHEMILDDNSNPDKVCCVCVCALNTL